MKKLSFYLNKYHTITPVWGIIKNNLSVYLSETTGEIVKKNKISISGKTVHLRGVSASLRSHISLHHKEITDYIHSIPEAEHLHLV